MTLIVSVLTPDFVVQVGDTRVVRPFANGDVGVVDDFRNKLTYYDGRAVFGYSGLANLDGGRTDQWIARVLSGRVFESDAAAVQALAKGAEEAVKSSGVERKYRRLAIAGVGWVSDESSKRQYSAHWLVSNFHAGDGATLGTPEDTFLVVTRTPRPNEPAVVSLCGWEPPAVMTEVLRKMIDRDIDQGQGAEQVLRHVVNWMREAATRSQGLIGENLLSVYIPKRAKPTVLQVDGRQPLSIGIATKDSRGKPIGLLIGGTPGNGPAFYSWSKGHGEPQPCGPNVAGPEMSSVLSAVLGGLGLIAPFLSPPATGVNTAPPESLPHVRFELVPDRKRFRSGDRLAIQCRIRPSTHFADRPVAHYHLAVLWNVQELQFVDVALGHELGGPEWSESLCTRMAPGDYNSADPLFSALVISERTTLSASEVRARQSATPTLATLRFRCLKDGPTRINAGFPSGPRSLLDSAGQPLQPASVRALLLNESED